MPLPDRPPRTTAPRHDAADGSAARDRPRSSPRTVRSGLAAAAVVTAVVVAGAVVTGGAVLAGVAVTRDGSTAVPAAADAAPTAEPGPDAAPVPTVEPEPAPPPVRAPEPVTLAFGGDVHFNNRAAAALRSGALDPIAPHLAGADLAVVNLETAITDRGTPAAKTFTFRAPARGLTALKEAGVDVVSMANNHGMDYGLTGLQDSLDASQRVGLPVIGVGLDEASAYAPYWADVKGSRIAVLGATQVLDAQFLDAWTAGPDKPGMASAKREERLLAEVVAARAQADTVVVYLHWGREKQACPLERQQLLAQRLVDAGADVIVGTHAHVLLGGGHLDGAYVHYGLGNFVWSTPGGTAAETGVLTLTVQGREVQDATWTPARIDQGGVPRPLSGAAADQALAAKERLRACTGLAAG